MRAAQLFNVTFKRRGYGQEHVMRVLGTSAANAVEAVVDFELGRGFEVVLQDDTQTVRAKRWKF